MRGEVAVPVGEVEQAEGEREEDPGGGVDLGGAVRRALPRGLYLPLPTVALHQTAPFYLQPRGRSPTISVSILGTVGPVCTLAPEIPIKAANLNLSKLARLESTPRIFETFSRLFFIPGEILPGLPGAQGPQYPQYPHYPI